MATETSHEFHLYRKTDQQIFDSSQLSEIFIRENPSLAEKWMFILPHDDDAVIGGGLLLQKAVIEQIPVSVLITSNGKMGYCDLQDKETIVETRKRETQASFNILGISEIYWLNFPDCQLNEFMGRRPAQDGDPCVIANYTGIQNAYTYYLRKICPNRVFIATGEDLHPDHKVVYQEVLISLFHASGDIWPELGVPLSTIPHVYEMAIYYDFPKPPNIKIVGDESHLQKKLNAIRAYRSQKQIESLVKNIQKNGPIEYFRDIEFKFYSPSNYETLF